ncbi:hypothetical protein, partial [Mycobacterium tuberculosis]
VIVALRLLGSTGRMGNNLILLNVHLQFHANFIITIFFFSGQRFAHMQTRVGLIALLSKFKFEISEKHSPKQLQFDPKSFFLSPKG